MECLVGVAYEMSGIAAKASIQICWKWQGYEN